MNKALGRLGALHPIDGFMSLLRLPRAEKAKRKQSIAVVNWIEDGLTTSGGWVTPWTVLRTLLIVLILKRSYSKVYSVRHNNYPHGTRKLFRRFAAWYSELLEPLYNAVLVMSPAHCRGKRLYMPHPAYVPIGKATELPKNLRKCEHGYVWFGRIEGYKQLPELVRSFPPNQQLMIIGHGTDTDLVADLISLVSTKENIAIHAEYLPYELVEEVLRRAKAFISAHHDEDLIVSGSLMLALSVGCPVLVCESPYSRWLADELGPRWVKNFASVQELGRSMEEAQEHSGEREELVAAMKAKFGQVAVEKVLAPLMKL